MCLIGVRAKILRTVSGPRGAEFNTPDLDQKRLYLYAGFILNASVGHLLLCTVCTSPLTSHFLFSSRHICMCHLKDESILNNLEQQHKTPIKRDHRIRDTRVSFTNSACTHIFLWIMFTQESWFINGFILNLHSKKTKPYTQKSLPVSLETWNVSGQ